MDNEQNVGEQQTEFPKIEQASQEQPVNNLSHRSFSKSKKIASVIVILVLLGAAGAAAYAYYSGSFVSLPSLTSSAMDSARAANSASFDTTVNIDFSGMKDVTSGLNQMLSGSLNTGQLSFTSKGSYDTTDSNNKKSSTDISINMGSLSLAVELKVVNNIFYAELTKAPTLAFLPVLSAYENKWYSYPFKSENGQIVNNPLTSAVGVDPNITSKITADQREHIYQMSRDAHFIKTVQRFAPETIGGELSYHFLFDLDREGITSYLQSLKEYVNTIGKNDSELSAFDPTSVSKALDRVKDFKGEIWIGRNDKLLHKLTLNFGIMPDLTKDEQIKLTVVGIMSGWNQPVSIIAPAESTPFATLVSAAEGDAQQKAKEAVIKAYLTNMRAQAELFYDASTPNAYSGFCSSAELKTAQKAIEDQGGTEFICKDKATAYAIAARFPANTGYWCVDSTGVSKATTALLSGTVCPAK